MTPHTTLRQPVRTLAARSRLSYPSSRARVVPPCRQASLTPALPPAFEAFCALHRDRYLDYARVHLPDDEAHSFVRGVLGELAVRWPYVVSHPNPSARAWTLLSARIRARRPLPAPLDTCPASQYDALVLHCLLEYSSTAAAETMGVEPSKIRYLVCSASPASRRAARLLRPDPPSGPVAGCRA
ncbi:hypothetical protein ACWEO4_09675 [Streptomyces sp. NPDC004393]|uniref:hypothetical protein n=1 Tax=Streptomyces sp. NPDC004533 TaxID=3154278 RepID=UPI0033AA25FB